VTGHWVIPLTRQRLRQGKPAGTIRVGVSLDHFMRLFNEINIGKQGSLVLASTDGNMPLRRPTAPSSSARAWPSCRSTGTMPGSASPAGP
jgi:hypothetical protein